MEHLLYKVDEGVATVTINRPDIANAFKTEVKDEFSGLLRSIKRDRSVRALVITGAGKTFCAGGDISTMGVMGLADGRERMRLSNEWVLELVELEKPTIAAINGAAAGVGVGLALACDFIAMAENAKLMLSFSNLGLVPDGATTYFMPRRIGIAKTKLIVYQGLAVSGSEAEKMGLADFSLPQEKLMEFVYQMACRLAGRPTYAIGLAKKMINYSFETDFSNYMNNEANMQALAFQTKDHLIGVKAFLDRTPPKFVGE